MELYQTAYIQYMIIVKIMDVLYMLPLQTYFIINKWKSKQMEMLNQITRKK
jgi:hypothetical protein